MMAQVASHFLFHLVFFKSANYIPNMKQKTHRQNTLEARKEETAVTALQSQQQALEALALQQKSQSVAQQEFHSQLSEVVPLT